MKKRGSYGGGGNMDAIIYNNFAKMDYFCSYLKIEMTRPPFWN